ncbi:hypothetical protein FRB97_009272 [Tulasnella sp. 331]|nr:hypothetical protein FRB98_005003 [Tulasnella sp. 332]KAG8881650.1 hypothetical protein FRB97_009272 [Tulasnella sp. 331]
MLMTPVRTITTLAALVPLASANGIVSLIRSGITATRGPDPPPAAALSSAVRRVSTVNPTTDVTSSDMTCGPGAQTAKSQFAVPSGGGIQFFWTGALGADGNRPNWNDTIGPILTYITPCTGSCSTFDPTSAPWFKVDQQGQVAGNSTQWVQSDLTINHPPTISIPNVPNGDYLMRNEVIVLANATTLGGAQFYVSCSQVTVSGADETASLPISSLGVKFPGAYNASDPGILVPDIDATNFVYSFPGGNVLTFGGASNSTNSSTTTAATTNATSTALALPTNLTTTVALNTTGTATNAANVTASTIVSNTTAAATSTVTTNGTSTIVTLNPVVQTSSGSTNAAAIVSSAVAANTTTTVTKTRTHTNQPHTRTTPTAGAATSTIANAADVAPLNSTETAAVVGAVTVTATATATVTATVTINPGAAAQATSTDSTAGIGTSAVAHGNDIQYGRGREEKAPLESRERTLRA